MRVSSLALFLRLCHGISRICAWGRSRVFDLALRVDFVIRNALSSLWVIMLLSRSVFGPLRSSLATPLKHVLNKPYLSIVAPAGVVIVAYFTHTSQSSLSSSLARVVAVVTTDLDCWARAIGSLSERAFGTGNALGVEMCGPIVKAAASSPNLALASWLFAVATTKARTQIRIKTLAVKIVVFYASGVTSSSIAQMGPFTFVVWLLLSLFVDWYEERSHKRARNLLERSNVVAGQSEKCIICLESLHVVNQERLICGHVYHGDCIRKWLNSSKEQRCPICRRAAGRWNQLFEAAP